MPTKANPAVNYLSRDFNSLRADLINFAKTYHSDKLAYMNDANPDVMYLEMCAYVGDVLSYYTDKTFNESFLTTALARESLFRIANDLGFFELGPVPSQTQVILSIKVPYISDPNTGIIKPDPDMLVAIKSGMQLSSDTGVFFEVQEEVDFADARNRKVIPNLDSNNQVVDYTIEKSAVAIAGITKIQRFYVSPDQAKPFLSIAINDTNVIQVLSAVDVPGNVFVSPPDEDFISTDTAYVEVRMLIENKKFVEINPTDQIEQQAFSSTTIRHGDYVDIPKRFIARRDVNGLITITFGSGNPDVSEFNNSIQSFIDSSSFSLSQVLNNTTLGEVPAPNSTLFIKYRVGGGTKSNIIAGQLNTISSKAFFPSTATNLIALQQVRNSLKVRNDIPAVGGREELTNEEIRNTAGKIFFAQDRGVTYEDVKNIIERMPPEFGRPFRIAYEEIKPRVANFSDMRGGLNTLLGELLQETDSVSRQVKVDEINTYLDQLQNGTAYIPVSGNNQVVVATSTETTNLLNATPSLWLGEKARLYIVGIDENSQLTTIYRDPTTDVLVFPNDALKYNIRNYLRDKRVIGDWIDIVDGRVINFQVDFTVMVDKKNKQQVLTDCLNKLRDYFKIDNWQMNQPIFVANVMTALQEIDGVMNVVEVKFINVFGEDADSGRLYAAQETGRYFNIDTTPLSTQNNKYYMKTVNNVILARPDMIFEIKYPNSDIIGRAL